MSRSAAMPRRWRSVALASLVLAVSCSNASPDIAAQPRSDPSAPPSAPSPIPSGTPEPPTRFAVIGDWGSGTQAQSRIARRMCAVREREPFDVVVTTGDNFYPSGRATRDVYDRPMACLLEHDGHRWRASWGNHDIYGSSNSTRRVLGAKHYYSFTMGDVGFFVLDSNAAGNGEQRRWLEARLRSSAAPMKVAVFHHPPYTGGHHEPDSRVRRWFVPLLERYGVDLVLTGHNHVYEHHRVRGVDYVVSGGGGAVLYGCKRKPAGMRRCRSVHHFLLVTAQGGTATVRAVEEDGSTLDRFEIRY